VINHAVLADTGRPTGGGAVNLLNAGWTFTTAIPLPDGGYTLPGQALAVFVEATWDQLNRPHPMVIELTDDDESQIAQIMGPEVSPQPARIEQELIVSPVPGAPNGVPGHAAALFDLPAGTLRIPATRRRYSWRVSVAGEIGGVGFWVQPPPAVAIIGQPPPSS